VKGNHTSVTFGNGENWRYSFRILKDADLFLSKPPWGWRGWLTKDSSRAPKNHWVRLAVPREWQEPDDHAFSQ